MQTRFIFRSRLPFVTLALFATLAACGGSSGGAPSPDADASLSDDASPAVDGAPAADAPATTVDGAASDGTPMRRACTGAFGNALSMQFGRLDGYLVSVVDPGQGKSCNGDSTHVHLQVLVNGSVYDVAVNTDGLEAEKDAPLPDGAWSEGWHTTTSAQAVTIDYPSTFGVHASDFTLTGTSQVAARIESEVANANHISVFATGYGPDGAHLVHRQGHNDDGAVVIDPLAPVSHFLLFRFIDQSF